MEHLKFETQTLNINEVAHESSFSFDRRARPHIISIISPDNMPAFDFDIPEKRPTLFNCPPGLAGLWMRALFKKGNEIMTECRKIFQEQGLSGMVSVQYLLYFRMLCLHVNVFGLVFYAWQLEKWSLICSTSRSSYNSEELANTASSQPFWNFP